LPLKRPVAPIWPAFAGQIGLSARPVTADPTGYSRIAGSTEPEADVGHSWNALARYTLPLGGVVSGHLVCNRPKI